MRLMKVIFLKFYNAGAYFYGDHQLESSLQTRRSLVVK